MIDVHQALEGAGVVAICAVMIDFLRLTRAWFVARSERSTAVADAHEREVETAFNALRARIAELEHPSDFQVSEKQPPALAHDEQAHAGG